MTTNEVKRRAFTSHLTAAINKLNTQLEEDLPDEVKVKSLIEQVEAKFLKVETIANTMQDDMDEDALVTDIDKMEELENKVIDVKVKAKSTLEKLQTKYDIKLQPGLPAEQGTEPQQGLVYYMQQPSVSAKLPDAKLQEFHGDEESFPSFIDNFTALVDSNKQLPDIEKFAYLRGVVKVDVINHYPMTAENYKYALAKLKKVYGDQNLIATKHLNSLLDMSKRKKPTNNNELQELYNFLETKLTCLDALKRPVEQTNQMLITLIYRQMPKKIKSKIAQLDTSHTTVTAVMNIISNYIKTAKQMDFREESGSESDDEMYDATSKVKPRKKSKAPIYSSNLDSEEDESSPISSAAALPVLTRRNRPCIYCNSNHSPLYCQNVTDINQRRDIVKQSNRCFNCITPGHRSSQCRSPGRCRFCQGKHHSSLCLQNHQSNVGHQSGDRAREFQHREPRESEFQNREPRRTSTNFQSLNTAKSWEPAGSVLLQMAEAELSTPHGHKYVNANIFFDLGSQWSYCSKQVKDELGLQSIATDVLELNTFGRTDSTVSQSDVVTLQISKGDFVKEITVHTIPSICNPLPSFKITKRKLNELGGIKLASPRCKHDGVHEISLLIGADLYWQFVESESIPTSWGARAVKSKLGWLLSGPVSNRTGTNTAINIVNSKILKSMKLDEFPVDKEWIKEKLPQEPELKYLDKFETVSETTVTRKVNKNETLKETKRSKANKELTQVTQVSAAAHVIPDYYNIQDNHIHDDIEEVDDWFKYKAENTIPDRGDVDLSWFWEIEHIGIIPEEKEPSVWQQFEQEVNYVEELKRYQVGFPCKMNILEDLPDNHHLAEVRLKSLLMKLNKSGNEDLQMAYDGIIKQQLKDEIIEEVNTDSCSDNAIHYLSHHCVIRKDKPTTEVRMVFDGSAKSNKKALSLNQCLYTGPSLVNNLAAVLMRFRMYIIGLISDITKAFLMLSLKPDDRDLTRFLWRENGNLSNPIKVFRFTRVPFGLSSSPFLLHATIIHHLGQFITKYPRTVPKLLKSFYVDDLLTGDDTEEEAVESVTESNTIMKEASMELKKWASNSANVFKSCDLPEDAKLPTENKTMKVLGLTWNKELDQFEYNVQSIIDLTRKLKPSKRTVLKIVQKIYDPLGALSPYMITAKVLLQKLCKLSLGWDDLLPNDLMEEWKRWTADLHQVEKFNLPRCVKPSRNVTLELVGFCDASKIAYAAVVYLRCSTNDEVKSNLLIAKSRVSPMKPLTIPRLELLGAVLLARLVAAVLDFLSMWKFVNVTYCTDSMNVLCWILDLHGTKKWNRYINKRVDEVNTLTLKEQWKHCKGNDNPADYPTRGMTMDQLSSSKEWLHGPEWMSDHTLSLKQVPVIPTPSDEYLDEELKVVHSHAVTDTVGISQLCLLKLDDYSNLMKLYRVTAYIYMFIKMRIQKEETSHTEMQKHAERRWISNEQNKYYGVIMPYLTGKDSKPPASIPNQLDLFLDKNGVIRCYGRYKYSNLSYSVKYPILLPKESHLTTLIIRDRHRRVKHAGVKTTLTQIREEFWIPKGRKLVKSILGQCVICRRLNAKPFKAPGPPPLPAIRLSDMPPFTNTGVDFAGPLYCRERGDEEAYKSYISLYTCASTRAVHLELVPNMNSSSFKNSLIRFISTRGVPHCMISDNAKTFKKTAEDLKCIISRSPTREFIEDNKIVWLFYLEKSPWWGGFIERMVGVAKSILRKILYRAFLSYDEMTTLLKEIESIINSRPITYVYNDEVVEPLTPSHLLIGKRTTQLPTDEIYSNDSDDRNRYRERLRGLFEKRWKKEYLAELQEYHIMTRKAKGVEIVPQVGDVVIMKDSSPRCNWKLVKVVKLHESNDGKVRSVEVLKPNKRTVNRPPQLLIPLECKYIP